MDTTIENIIHANELCFEKCNTSLLQQGPHGELKIIQGIRGPTGSVGEGGYTGYGGPTKNPSKECSICLVYKEHKIHDPECSVCADYRQHFNCDPQCEVCDQHQQHDKSNTIECPKILIKQHTIVNDTVLNNMKTLIESEFTDSVICNSISSQAMKGELKPEFEQQLQQLQEEHKAKHEIYEQQLETLNELESKLHQFINENGGYIVDDDYCCVGYGIPEPRLNIPNEWYDWTYQHSMSVIYLPESSFAKVIEPFLD